MNLSATLLVFLFVTGILLADIGLAQEESTPLRIISPPDGTVVTLGETITVVVEAKPGTDIRSLALWGANVPGVGMEVSPGEMQEFELPITFSKGRSIGSAEMIAFAVNTKGERFQSPPVTLHLERSDTPTELKIVPSPIAFRFIGDDRQLNVRGIFADGSLEFLENSTFTSLLSSDPTVAEVGERGLVRATGPGEAVITVQHRDLSAEVPVTVPDKQPPDRDEDGVPDEQDNCPDVANPGQENRDNDFLGDACDDDTLGLERGDLDGDGDIDAADRDRLRSALGASEGEARFVPAADYDGDGKITYGDYRIWNGFFQDVLAQ